MNCKPDNILRIVFCLEWLIAALLAIAFEAGWLPAGELTVSAQTAYIFEVIGVALAIICIPLALRQTCSFTWKSIRLALLGTSLLYNLLMYYLLGFDTTCGYLALMSAVALLFVWPKKERVTSET